MIAVQWYQDNCDIYNTWCNEAVLNCNGTVGTDDVNAFVQYWLESPH